MASHGTVTGTFVDTDGTTPAAGTVVFMPAPAWILDAAETKTIMPSQVAVDLDATGSLSTSLLATDDTTLNPSGWTWNVTVLIHGAQPRSFSFSLPGGTTVDLTTASPVNGSVGNAVVVGPTGAAATVADVGAAITADDPTVTGPLNANYAALNGTYSDMVYTGGNLTSWTQNGVACSATYNADGTVHTLTTGTTTRTFTYDASGNLTGAA